MDRLTSEAIIREWLKEDGQEVGKGDVLGIIETVKAEIEIEAPESGIFYKRYLVESVVHPGETIAFIIQPGEKVPEIIIEEPKKIEVVKGRVPVVEAKERVVASPLVRKLAREHGIDLSSLKGTGVGGKILRKDILSYIEKKAMEVAIEEKKEVVPLSGWRRIMAEHMSKSKHTAAHATTVAEVDATELVRLHSFMRDSGTPITYTAFAVKAVAQALREHPIINASLVGDNIIIKKEYNIGFAVAVDESGLVVPVIHDANKKDILEIAKTITELTRKARENRLSVKDTSGGTFTVTNPGMMGVIFGTPIINLPQTAILEVGAIVKRPAVVNDEIAIRSIMYLALSYDHRVITGASAIVFLQKVRRLLENPNQLLPSKEGFK